MWRKTAKPGDKVICITKGRAKPDSWPDEIWETLQMHQIYTVLNVSKCKKGRNLSFLRLEGFPEGFELDARGFSPFFEWTLNKTAGSFQ